MATEQKTVKVQLVRIPNGCKDSHRATVRGMINKIDYLVKIV